MQHILRTKLDGVFIIGNGFDLDLGLPSSYRSFAESSYWPFQNPDSDLRAPDSFDSEPRSLHNTLHYTVLDSTWFDIEATLARYATFDGLYDSKFRISAGERKQAIKDERTYNLLTQGLTDYLLSLNNHHLNKETVAARVLSTLIDNNYFTRIFSFNYTCLNNIAKSLGIANYLDYQHMHGNLNDGIILGLESNIEFCPLYRFMCKEYNMNYQTRFLNFCMQEAKEIVIFGHSLSEIDYHYFETLFFNQSKMNLNYPESKRITIFTRDKNSKLDICDQLRKMNKNRLDVLFSNNILEIIRTDGSDSKRVEKFIEHVNIMGEKYKAYYSC